MTQNHEILGIKLPDARFGNLRNRTTKDLKACSKQEILFIYNVLKKNSNFNYSISKENVIQHLQLVPIKMKLTVHTSFSESSQDELLLQNQNSEDENSEDEKSQEARIAYDQLNNQQLNSLRSLAIYPLFNEIIYLPFPPAEEILNKIQYTNYAGWMIWKQLSTPQLKRIFYEESMTLYMNKKKYKEIPYKFL
ncbi:hypothetical protein M0812_25028 [Anaeramoeba flamelloides]|uniref:Uncharacterized protein n=1 Tax=Anaeramoeba flamelloides TaxID=1746091 RepID=A0AAV7YNZ9_9EUKA|nr:hypothetical protein M0812_25028 [Anaeramoeba flamelloides]